MQNYEVFRFFYFDIHYSLQGVGVTSRRPCSAFCGLPPYSFMLIVAELINSTDERDYPESQDDDAGNFVHQG
jgi:hypothetical protein